MADNRDDKAQHKHRRKMQAYKAKVDSSIAAAGQEQSVVLLLTGDGKGKTSSAFGMIMRSLGYGHRVGVVQFIKGVQLSGEELFLRDQHPEVDFYQMGTGFTWDTQDRAADIAAAGETWLQAERMLTSKSLQLVVLDELTYMLGYKYLDEQRVLNAIRNRPAEQSVVITGRGGGAGLQQLADTVSDVKNIKHAYNSGAKARKGVDY